MTVYVGGHWPNWFIGDCYEHVLGKRVNQDFWWDAMFFDFRQKMHESVQCLGSRLPVSWTYNPKSMLPQHCVIRDVEQECAVIFQRYGEWKPLPMDTDLPHRFFSVRRPGWSSMVPVDQLFGSLVEFIRTSSTNWLHQRRRALGRSAVEEEQERVP